MQAVFDDPVQPVAWPASSQVLNALRSVFMTSVLLQPVLREPVNQGNGLISIGDLVKAIISDQRFTIEHLEHYISGERG